MPGIATVTIGDKQWSVDVAVSASELQTGLGGLESIPAGTGMLFDLGTEQTVEVTTQPMLFNIDIIFISESLEVVDIVEDVAPGYLVTEQTPVRYFLEVNAGEAQGIEAGDSIEITDYEYTPPSAISEWMPTIIGISMLGFVGAMVGGMMGGMFRSSSHSLGHPSSPEEATFPPEARQDLTFCKHMWDLEKTIGRPFTREEVSERWERWKELRYRPKTEEERRLSHSLKYGTEELPERGKAKFTPEVQAVIDKWRIKVAKGEPFVEAEARREIIRAGGYKLGIGETDRAVRAITGKADRLLAL